MGLDHVRNPNVQPISHLKYPVHVALRVNHDCYLAVCGKVAAITQRGSFDHLDIDHASVPPSVASPTPVSMCAVH